MKKVLFIVFAVVICMGLVSCKGDAQSEELSEVIVSTDAFSEDEIIIESKDPDEKEAETIVKESQETKDIAQKEPETDKETSSSESFDYVLNTNSKKFHYPTCSSASQTKDTNKAFHSGTRNELVDMGYSPCGRCKP